MTDTQELFMLIITTVHIILASYSFGKWQKNDNAGWTLCFILAFIYTLWNITMKMLGF